MSNKNKHNLKREEAVVLCLFSSVQTRDQLGSRVVRAFAPCLEGPGFDSRPSQTKDFKLVVV